MPTVEEEMAALREEVLMLRQMLGGRQAGISMDEDVDGVSMAELECHSPMRPAELQLGCGRLSPERGEGGLAYDRGDGEMVRVDRKNGEVEAMWIRYGSNAKMASRKREVSFYGKAWGDVVCLAASEILTQPGCQVEILNLGCTNITSKGIAALGMALRSPTHTLRSLKLNGNPLITDEGTDILFKSLSPYIHTLEIGDCGVTSVGTEAITNTLPHLPNFKHLFLYCNPEIGDLGAAHFAEAVSRGYELETLNLQDCGISSDARRWLISASIKVTF
eukprot:TRINITY_DN29160_c0_g1_i1.p1 TRINITY_DN29160_c0_g1~~TRINITY_DN29160_c0_g1_i1.p1  ORF type:complete len:285 (+),score=61.17 TRINITY_DN29160_c0_g1_i1:28-855(+)